MATIENNFSPRPERAVTSAWYYGADGGDGDHGVGNFGSILTRFWDL